MTLPEGAFSAGISARPVEIAVASTHHDRVPAQTCYDLAQPSTLCSRRLVERKKYDASSFLSQKRQSGSDDDGRYG
jgi:hypothetical protein